MNKNFYLQTDDPENPVTDPDKNPSPDSLPPDEPNPYPVTDPIPDVEPVPNPPEPTPEYPPVVIF
jgi:hypothetical protein